MGACMAGGHAWGACMAGEMDTAMDRTYPTGMHSCLDTIFPTFMWTFLGADISGPWLRFKFTLKPPKHQYEVKYINTKYQVHQYEVQYITTKYQIQSTKYLDQFSMNLFPTLTELIFVG